MCLTCISVIQTYFFILRDIIIKARSGDEKQSGLKSGKLEYSLFGLTTWSGGRNVCDRHLQDKTEVVKCYGKYFFKVFFF